MPVIAEIIADLLLRHNCVVIPEFGGFVAKPTGAHIDRDKGIMRPPSKTLLFNKQLVNNDGLLLTELANRLGIGYEAAQLELRAYVQCWKEELDRNARVELDKIGFLYLDSEKNLCFEQDRMTNLLLASFGMGSVAFIPEEHAVLVLDTVEQQKIEVPETPASTMHVLRAERNQKLRGSKKIIRYVAAACLVPLAFYAFWIPTQTSVLESGMISLRDFNPFAKTTETQYNQVVTEVSTVEVERHAALHQKEDGTLALSIDDVNEIPVKIDPVDQPQVPDVDQTFTAQSLHLVVGCFGSETNAVNLVAKLKTQGFDARIVDVSNGLHRVSAGAAISQEALTNMQNELLRAGYKPWVLK